MSALWPTVLATSVALGSCVWIAWQAGGFFAPDVMTVMVPCYVTLAVVAGLGVSRRGLSDSALIGLGGLVGLAAWTGVSSRWSAAPSAALDLMHRDLLYVGLFALGLLAAGSGRYVRWIVPAVLIAVFVVVGAGLLSRIAPDVLSAPGPTDVDAFRLSYPLGYWNVFGGLAAFGVVLATGMSADPRSSVVGRALCSGAAVVFFVAMYLSFSRGAWLALIVGTVVLFAFGAHRGSLVLAVAIVGVTSAFAVLALRGHSALTEDPRAGTGQEHEGHAYAAKLAVLVGAAVASMALIAAGRASRSLMAALRRVMRPVAATFAVLALLAAVGTYVVRAGPIEGVTANAVDDTASWISRQWQDFLRPASFSEGGTARLTSAKGTRSDLYRVAIDGIEGSPLQGDGGGSFVVRWTRTRRVGEYVINAHSLELETIGELGAVGGLLLLLFLGSLGVAAVRSRRGLGGLSRSRSAAVAAACSVWMAHSFVDWDWQMPAFTGMVLLLAATLYPVGRGRRRRSSRSLPAMPMVDDGGAGRSTETVATSRPRG